MLLKNLGSHFFPPGHPLVGPTVQHCVWNSPNDRNTSQFQI